MSGFLDRNGLETFYNYNPNIVLLKNIPGYNRYLPALRFTCNTTITRVSFAATRASGVTSGTIGLEIQRVVRVHHVPLQHATPSDNPGVYELALSQPLPVQVNDVVSIFESRNPPLNLYNMDGGMSMKSTYIPQRVDQDVPPCDDDQPLMSIETGNTLLIEISSYYSVVLYCVKLCSTGQPSNIMNVDTINEGK